MDCSTANLQLANFNLHSKHFCVYSSVVLYEFKVTDFPVEWDILTPCYCTDGKESKLIPGIQYEVWKPQTFWQKLENNLQFPSWTYSKMRWKSYSPCTVASYILLLSVQHCILFELKHSVGMTEVTCSSHHFLDR